MKKQTARSGVVLPPAIKVLFNLLVLVAGVLVLRRGPGSLLPPCTAPEVTHAGLVVNGWLFAHLCWRFLSVPIRTFGDDLGLQNLKASLKLLATLADLLLARNLPDRTLLGLLALAVSGLGVVWWTNASGLQLLPLSEETPSLQALTVQRGESLQAPGGALALGPGERVLVRAALSSPAGSCVWTSAVRGALPVEAGCAVLYSAPLGRQLDILTLQIQSPCKTKNVFTHLTVDVRQP